MKNYVVVGNPNSGKSTLFNLLTGDNAKVGNWAGVTVSSRQAQLELDQDNVNLIDLPGLYELGAVGGPEDEAVSRQALLNRDYEAIINVVDATQLERHLYLTMQLRELGVPMIILLNKWDSAREQNLNIDTDELGRQFGCPVFGLSARRNKCRDYAIGAIKQLSEQQPQPWHVDYGESLEHLIAQQGGDRIDAMVKLVNGEQGVAKLQQISTVRFNWLEKAIAAAKKPTVATSGISDKIDKIVLHPVLGVPVFLLMMYLTFMFAIHMGAAFIDWFDIMAGTIFVDGVGLALQAVGAPELLVGLLSNGVGAGIQTVATFVPVVAFMFIALGVLETSGYLARAAFVVEGLMNRMGLPGKAFVPLIVGFGCNVPSITATRTLDQKRQRIMTSMMAPFMSCGARLPVYALFAAAFFPESGQNLVFILYVVGIAAAILTGLFLRFSLLPGTVGMSVMEMPSYEMPKFKTIMNRTWMRTRQFVVGAGKVIVIMVTLLSFANTLGTDGSVGNEDSDNSVLALAAQQVTPLFGPMGVQDDNWEATVGIITGIFAKEAVVGTLNSLYTPSGEEDGGEWDLLGALQEATVTIPENMLGIDLSDPLGMNIGDVSDMEVAAAELEVEVASLKNLQAGFVSTTAAVAYLLFILLYTPCAAVLGAIAGELGSRWAAFSAVWTLVVAYSVATAYYQLVSFGLAGAWCLIPITAVFVISFVVMRRLGKTARQGAGDIAVVVQ
ncbi:ferrous iron transport protein B [Ferrimonas lipolytica]|uniref:Ferrous iron transport protein B n=1 Tax=Ferrimonas lipolytica TaxID=2724191 RepID=A0A6H1UE02_9GAMM|nr:ferrous iron transport protein B [Ferrimonas lipolytica]QIZ76022.1 ferrous iron transport protein B [Ferrimonas lipolytica]